MAPEDWRQSPNNWRRSPNIWRRSPDDWRRSPDDWRRSPDRCPKELKDLVLPKSTPNPITPFPLYNNQSHCYIYIARVPKPIQLLQGCYEDN